ncbi:MAG: hypothetical protein HC869_17340 [Rhodospirillales bacterium]|nr:hypothetical protein [Rhodospirillales bacterium]
MSNSSTRLVHGGILNGVVRVLAPRPVTLIDTVGAGDTFLAALLTWLAERDRLSSDGLATLSGSDLAALLSFAAAAASITCSRRGADMPRQANSTKC